MRARGITAVMLSACLAVIAGVGCSGGAKKPRLEDAVRAYSGAFLGGDADTSYPLLSERCRATLSKVQFAVIVGAAHAQHPDLHITSYKDSISGDGATATYDLSDPSLGQTVEHWVFEGGSWHADEC